MVHYNVQYEKIYIYLKRLLLFLKITVFSVKLVTSDCHIRLKLHYEEKTP